MVTVSSPSPTLWRSFDLPFPSPCTSSSRGGEGGSETNFIISSCNTQHMWVRLHQASQYSGAFVTTIDLVWWMRRGVLRD
jgi:hypothetical protein